MPERYGNVVIPIFTEKGLKVKHEGSALLVRARDGSHWLASAAHVLAQPEGIKAAVPISKHAVYYVLGTTYSTCRLTPEEALVDRIDMAVVQLEPWMAEGLEQSGANFLPFDHLERSPAIADQQCAVTGYPDGAIEWNRNLELSRVEATRVHVWLHSNDKVRLRGYDPNVHIVARYGDTLADGTRQAFPRPRGMSGGVVWILRNDGPAAAGIITTCLSQRSYKRALLCTRMSGAANIIEDPSRANIIHRE